MWRVPIVRSWKHGALQAFVEQAVASNPKSVADYKAVKPEGLGEQGDGDD